MDAWRILLGVDFSESSKTWNGMYHVIFHVDETRKALHDTQVRTLHTAVIMAVRNSLRRARSGSYTTSMSHLDRNHTVRWISEYYTM